jgi:hypothetical protein
LISDLEIIDRALTPLFRARTGNVSELADLLSAAFGITKTNRTKEILSQSIIQARIEPKLLGLLVFAIDPDSFKGSRHEILREGHHFAASNPTAWVAANPVRGSMVVIVPERILSGRHDIQAVFQGHS